MPRILYVIDGSTPSRAAMMAFKAANIPVEIQRVDLTSGEQFAEWFLKVNILQYEPINPQHCVPTLNDDGFYLWESRAIMRYIMDSYADDDTMYPADKKDRAHVDRILDYDCTTLYRYIGAYVYPIKMFLQPPDESARKQLHNELVQFDSWPTLSAGQYVTGDHLTIADCSLLASVTFLESVDYDFAHYPNVERWVARCKALPLYDACNKGFEAWKQFSRTEQWSEICKRRILRMKDAGVL